MSAAYAVRRLTLTGPKTLSVHDTLPAAQRACGECDWVESSREDEGVEYCGWCDAPEDECVCGKVSDEDEERARWESIRESQYREGVR